MAGGRKKKDKANLNVKKYFSCAFRSYFSSQTFKLFIEIERQIQVIIKKYQNINQNY